jgi:hypothetical protein
MEQWEEHRAARLFDGAGGARTVDQLFGEIDALSETADERAEEILGLCTSMWRRLRRAGIDVGETLATARVGMPTRFTAMRNPCRSRDCLNHPDTD